MTSRTIAVVGGGITGLSAAYELTRGDEHPRVVLLEAGPSLGGKVCTNQIDGVSVEAGPDAVLARVPWAVDLMRELGLESEFVSPATGNAAVYARGRLRPLPDGLVLGVPAEITPLLRSGILSPLGIVRAGMDLVLPRKDLGDDPTITQVIGSRFGHQVVDRLVDPLLSGINAGRADGLSLRSTAPEVGAIASSSRSLLAGLRARKKKAATSPAPTGPVFVSLRDGLRRLVDRLVEELRAAGVELRTSTPVTALGGDPGAARWRVDPLDEPVDGVILAVPAYTAGPLLAEVSPTASRELGSIEYSSVAVATLVYSDAAMSRPLVESGFLVPRSEGWLMTATTFVSTKWPDQRPSGQVILRCSAGHHGDDRPAALSDDDLVRRLHAELQQAIGVTEAPRQATVHRWDRSFPQYGSGHLARADRIDSALAGDAPRVVVTGATMRGVGIAACVRQGRAAGAALRT